MCYNLFMAELNKILKFVDSNNIGLTIPEVEKLITDLTSSGLKGSESGERLRSTIKRLATK